MNVIVSLVGRRNGGGVRFEGNRVGGSFLAHVFKKEHRFIDYFPVQLLLAIVINGSMGICLLSSV